jgi:ParB family chromosome partitioning protein
MSAITIIPPAGIAGLAARIRAEHEAAQSALRSAVSHAVEAGKLLMEAKKSVPYGGWEAWVRDSCGFSERTAQGYMRLARLAPEEAQRVALLSLRDALKALADPRGSGGSAPLRWSGEVEWHTPAQIIEAAREVMGGRIDLDPASCETANETVEAARIYTIQDDGLAQPWHGRVFLNPPYADKLIGPFVTKLLAEIRSGNVPEAVLLTHARTDTAWFHEAASAAAAICFTRGRVRFQRPDGTGDAPPIGSAFFYFGPNPDRFAAIFGSIGLVFFNPPAAASGRLIGFEIAA